MVPHMCLRIHTYLCMNILSNTFSTYPWPPVGNYRLCMCVFVHTSHRHMQFGQSQVHDLCFSYCSLCHWFYACAHLCCLGEKKLYIKTDYLLHCKFVFILPSSFYEENDRKHKPMPLKKKMHEMKQVSFFKNKAKHDRQPPAAGGLGGKICAVYTAVSSTQKIKVVLKVNEVDSQEVGFRCWIFNSLIKGTWFPCAAAIKKKKKKTS